MQIDMHYYGVYVLARLAGLNGETARIIATSSQFVDDSFLDEHLMIEDGKSFRKICTAHHMKLAEGLVENTDESKQRMVWVPFHFVPGNEGKSLSEKLVCKKDSSIANQIIKFAVKRSKKEYGRELLGIAIHAYMDTFSHYGFSGVSSRINKIDNDSIKIKKTKNWLEEFLFEKLEKFADAYDVFKSNYRDLRSLSLENISGALGHGAVSIFPDLPYLKWEYSYETNSNYWKKENRRVKRDNPEDYMVAAEKVFKIFKDYSEENENYKDESIDYKFFDVKNDLKKVLSKNAKKIVRCKEWVNYTGNSKKLEETEIPVYYGDIWNSADPMEYNNFNEQSFYKFHRAAEIYRTYLLREIFPRENIFLI